MKHLDLIGDQEAEAGHPKNPFYILERRRNNRLPTHADNPSDAHLEFRWIGQIEKRYRLVARKIMSDYGMDRRAKACAARKSVHTKETDVQPLKVGKVSARTGQEKTLAIDRAIHGWH